ncbi:MAG: zinc-dependent metalloprotease [Gemmatimonadetes bacterium]|nr:zinc-dependent metalloprotease [Gemmatimonadota bacterium]
MNVSKFGSRLRSKVPVRAGGLALVLALVLAPACAPSRGAPPEAPRPDAGSVNAEAGILPVRYDAATGKVFLTVPRLDEELLYLNTLATGLGSAAAGLDRGQVGINAVVRFERHGSRVFLIRENTEHRALTDNLALRRSVEESFPRSVLAAFPVQSEGPAGLVVDATDFFLSDIYDVAGRIRGARLGTVRVDRDRSFIDAQSTKAFPMNTEIRSVLSYVTDDPSPEIRRHAPDGRTISLQQHHSFVRLPDSGLAIREFDPRAGLFAGSFFDFAQGFDSDYRQRGVVRWRLEPSDPTAYARGEKVEPVKPIVYYLDPAIPEPYRSAFLEGGMWWNEIFESAGWRNAFRVEMLPEGVDPMDARYPVIYWVHRQQRGPSVGPSFRDPRTGEIISTVVRMDSYRSLVDHDIYMGLLPAAGGAGLQITAEEFSMARRRQHTAHEIGHTLGLAHNFVAAAQNRASVMDYPYPLIRLDAQGRIDVADAYRPSGGAHDTLAIRYAYTWYPTPEAEAAGLKQIVREAEARGLRFIGDAHAAAAGSYPAASQWVEGNDMLEALQRTMAVRRVLIDRFDARAAQQGEPLAVLNRRFAHVYLHHRYALQGATKYVGGMEFGYALRGEETEPTRILPPEEQRRALRLVLAGLEPTALRIPDRVASLIPPVPSGYDTDLTLIPTPAGTAFDPVATAHSLAQEIVDGLLHPERSARLVSFHARNPVNPSLDEVLTVLVGATWGAPPVPRGGADAQDASLRRVAQRAALDGLLDLAGSPAATPEVRAVTVHHLQRLHDRLTRSAAAPAAEQGHRAAAGRDIERFFEGRDDRTGRTRPEPIRLPWP